MGSTELFFRRCPSLREFSRRLLGHAEPEGRPAKLTQFCSTLRARRAGHGAMARARLATSLSPVDSPSDDTSSAEICLAKLSRRWPAGRKKHDFTLVSQYMFRCVGHVVRAIEHSDSHQVLNLIRPGSR